MKYRALTGILILMIPATAGRPARAADAVPPPACPTPPGAQPLGPDPNVSLVRREPVSPSNQRVEIAVEYPDPIMADGGEARSSAVTLTVNCLSSRARLEFTRYFRSACLTDEFLLTDGSPAWSRGEPGSVEAQVIAGVCARDPTPQSPPPVSPPSLRRRISAAAPAGLFETQFLASSDQTESEKAAAAVRALLPGAAISVYPAAVDGRQVYRAVVTGLADRGAAVAVCERLRAQGRACFVRPIRR